MNSERRRQVAAMRAGTRAYLADIRLNRRRGPQPIDEPPPPPAAPAPATRLLPDPRLAALSPGETPSPSPRPVLKELPLASLRLLGQGMIWRLNNRGIHTLDDLAACDPEKLGESLGPIGRLLRCEVWIQAAREILSEPSTLTE